MGAEMLQQRAVGSSNAPWWRGAAIYQVYPRSYADSNGDGIGDLAGLTARLDHIANLGVDCIWLSPFYTSPMRDFGYDVADYCDVDPVFGTLADFDRLVAEIHRRGLRLIVDQVYSHSSDQHAWFGESRSNRDNPKADWYVWADAKDDGSPPNNWQSVFGGPAWEWDARRGQYYLHNFLAEQPDLNLHHPEVQEAVLNVARFWLDRGVDGFRIDAANFAMHDCALRDNPPAPPGHKRTRPFDFQQHLYNQGDPAIPLFLERLRAVTDCYGDKLLVAEVGGERALEEMRLYTSGDHRLHSAYSFDFLYADKLDGDLVCRVIANWPDSAGTGWPTIAFENHDAPRAVSRWEHGPHRAAFLTMKMALLASLRGSIIIYQGEELGLDQVEVPLAMIQDPEAIRNWPLTLSRDGARTPLPWTSAQENAGFSDARPWLPIGEGHRALAIDRQDSDPRSVLNVTRRLLKLRNDYPALRHGAVTRCASDGDLLVIDRQADGEMVRCQFNMGQEDITLTGQADGPTLFASGGATADRLPPFGALLTLNPTT